MKKGVKQGRGRKRGGMECTWHRPLHVERVFCCLLGPFTTLGVFHGAVLTHTHTHDAATRVGAALYRCAHTHARTQHHAFTAGQQAAGTRKRRQRHAQRTAHGRVCGAKETACMAWAHRRRWPPCSCHSAGQWRTVCWSPWRVGGAVQAEQGGDHGGGGCSCEV